MQPQWTMAFETGRRLILHTLRMQYVPGGVERVETPPAAVPQSETLLRMRTLSFHEFALLNTATQISYRRLTWRTWPAMPTARLDNPAADSVVHQDIAIGQSCNIAVHQIS